MHPLHQVTLARAMFVWVKHPFATGVESQFPLQTPPAFASSQSWPERRSPVTLFRVVPQALNHARSAVASLLLLCPHRGRRTEREPRRRAQPKATPGGLCASLLVNVLAGQARFWPEMREDGSV